MKILFVVGHPKYLIGGAEVQAYKLAKELKKNNWEVEYLNPFKTEKESVVDENEIKIHFYKTIRFFRIFEIFNSLKILSKINTDVYYLRGTRFTEAFAVLYKNLFNRKAVTIFQNATGAELTKMFYTLSLLRTKRPVVILKRIFDELTYDLTKYYTIKKADVIFAQSEENKRLFKKVFARESIKVLKGISLEKDLFSIDKDDHELNVFYIRNIKPVSRIEYFIEIVRKIKEQKETKIIFHVFGNIIHPDKEKILKEFEELGIIYYGRTENCKVLKYLEKAHILVDTLYEETNVTTLSTAFLEAWSRKVVILSFCSNPDNILEENKIGFSIKNIDNAVEKILFLNNNKKLLKEMGENAIKYLEKSHSLENEVNAIIRESQRINIK